MKKFLASALVVALSNLLPVSVALADDISNGLDLTVDSALETMNLSVGGPSGSTMLRVIQRDGDGKNGCNFQGHETLVVSVNNSHPSVVTVASSPTITFASCGDTPFINIVAVGGGTATISLSVISNNTGDTFNLTTASFTVNVVADGTAPTLNLPLGITAEATSAAGAAVSYSATATDANPASPAVSCLPASGSVFPLGLNWVSCESTDAAGNTAHGTFSVTVQDTTAPAISGTPSMPGVEAVGPSGAVVTYVNPTATDLVDGPVAVSCLPASGSVFPLGVSTVTCDATDAAGNDSSVQFNLEVVDTTAPVLIVPASASAEATGPSGAAVSFEASATDTVDGPVAVSCEPPSGSEFALGTTTVICEAVDAASNSAQASFEVEVSDTTAPSIDSHDDESAEATSPSGAVVTFDVPAATDIVDGDVTVSCLPASGSVFALGSTQVTCTATDAAGNSASSQFNVLVSDTTPPEIAAHGDETAEAASAAGAVVSYENPSVSDLADADVTAVCLPASGSVFALGETEVTCTATDDSGNFAVSAFTVTVVDTTGPAVSTSSDLTAEATSPAGAEVSYEAATATDLVDGSVAVSCEPASGSVFPLGETIVTCEAVDAAGNSGSSTFTVTVQDTVAPTVSIVRPTARDYTLHQAVLADYSCADSGSGIASCTGTVANGAAIDTSTLGAKTFGVTAVDAVGLTTSASVNYNVVGYRFVGFGAPLIISKADVKKNSTVPVKFKLFDTDNNPVSLAVATLKVNGVNAVASGSSNVGNLFRYDVSGGQYIFNLSTKPLALGTNVLVATLDDGSSYSWTIIVR